MPRCCVPHCSSRGVSRFSFPKNEERRQLWLKHIPMEDFVPENSSAVCIKHFDEKFILQEKTVKKDDGTLSVVPRDIVKLSADAYPTNFEEYNKLPSDMKKVLNTETKKKTMTSTCCMPLCATNYRIARVTTFAFPTNEERRQLWLNQIPREIIPGNSAVLCIKHFKEEFILREVTITRDERTSVDVRRYSLKLADDAYPTIFEEYNKVPSYRKVLLHRRGKGIQRKRKTEEDVSPEATTVNKESEEDHVSPKSSTVNEESEEDPVSPKSSTVNEESEEESDTVMQTEPAISSNTGVTSDSEESHVTMEHAVTREVGENIQGPYSNISYQLAQQDHTSYCLSPYEPRRNANIHKGALSTSSEASTQTLGNAMAKTVKNDSSEEEVLTSNGVQQFRPVIKIGQTLYCCEECPALFTSYVHLEEHKKNHPVSQPIIVYR